MPEYGLNEPSTFMITSADGLQLHVNVTEPLQPDLENDVPVLLQHGWPDSGQLWRHQVKALSQAGRRTIVPDLRGLGRSDRPRSVDGYRLDHAVQDVLTVLDALDIPKVDLVGHDYGAAIAWIVASFVPERVRRLAALSVGHPLAFKMAPLEQERRSWYMLLFQFEGVAEKWLSQNVSEFLSSHRDLKQVVAFLKEPGTLTAALNWYRANAHPRRLVEDAPDIPSTPIPVLGIWSSQDIYLTEDQMVGSASFVSGPWTYRKIEGAGHWMQLDTPHELNEMLLGFLSSYPTS